MPSALSVDLRERVVHAVEAGASRHQAVKRFGISLASAGRLCGRSAPEDQLVRWAKRKGLPAGSWLGQMLARKPPTLVIVAVANKNACIAWALLTKGGIYRPLAVTA